MADKKKLRITERANARFKGVDQWPTEDFLSMMLEEQIKAVMAIRDALPQITTFVDQAASRLKNGKGRIIYIGAGTPIRIGAQDGIELTPTYGWSRDRMAFVVAGGKEALFTAIEGAEDDETAARNTVQRLNIGPDDVCIAVSASGITPFTRAAVEAARKAGALTVGFANNPDAPLLTDAELPIYVNSGPEPVGGSTRMNAGTVQKVVMNMISTALMNKLGHIFDGYMVDVIPTNDKLRERQKNMVMAITGCAEDQAVQALKASGKGLKANVKLAVLIVAGLTAEEGRQLLREQEGSLRGALQSISPRPMPLTPIGP